MRLGVKDDLKKSNVLRKPVPARELSNYCNREISYSPAAWHWMLPAARQLLHPLGKIDPKHLVCDPASRVGRLAGNALYESFGEGPFCQRGSSSEDCLPVLEA